MKILLVSGFLGAGKTSFIKTMAEKTGEKFVIVENEFGDLDLDARLLKKEDADLKIWELTEGCICCSLNLDFTHSVLTIANSLNPDYLVVEPSGVAMVSKIIEQLNKIAYERIEILAPITIIDASNFEEISKNFKAHLDDQVASAGEIVFSKSENMSEQTLVNIKNTLSLSENVRCNLYHYSLWSSEEWSELLRRKIKIDSASGERSIIVEEKIKEEKLENFSLTNTGINSVSQLAETLMSLLMREAGYVYRAKGYLNIGKNWFKFDLVGSEYRVTGCEKMDEVRIVVIGKNLSKKNIKRLFDYKEKTMLKLNID